MWLKKKLNSLYWKDVKFPKKSPAETKRDQQKIPVRERMSHPNPPAEVSLSKTVLLDHYCCMRNILAHTHCPLTELI